MKIDNFPLWFLCKEVTCGGWRKSLDFLHTVRLNLRFISKRSRFYDYCCESDMTLLKLKIN